MEIQKAKVIITGATGGIGYAIAGALKAAEAQVAISGRNAAKVDTAVAALGVHSFTADVTQETNIAGLFSFAIAKQGVSGLTDCWRAELRPHNFRVMQVNPGTVITDFIGKAGIELRTKNES